MDGGREGGREGGSSKQPCNWVLTTVFNSISFSLTDGKTFAILGLGDIVRAV